MKTQHISIYTFLLLLNLTVYGQDNPSRGPLNVLNGGVVDGVVIKDELPIRSIRI